MISTFAKKYICLFICFVGLNSSAQDKNQSLSLFRLDNVRLLPSEFKNAQETDLRYILELDPDRLLAPYIREAGLEPRSPSYGNWEDTGLDGHTAGHYLSALSFMFASTSDENLGARIDYFLAELQRCQNAHKNGYLGGIPGGASMWRDVGNGKIEASEFSLNGRWVPLYNIHKMFAGLYDAWNVTNKLVARDLLIKLTDWFIAATEHLQDDRIQLMLVSEHGGLNEVFANMYAMTKDIKYLNLARRFSHQAILRPLLESRDELTGIHANTQIPKVIGYESVAAVSGDSAWHQASDFFWHNVVNKRSISFGGNSVREHFNATNDFISMLDSREGPETCNSYNMLKLTKLLFQASPKSSYIDFFERTLYNHILSSQRPDGGFVYFTPIRPGHYRTYSTPQCSFWCCVGSGLENHGKYGELIYSHSRNDLYINLFIPSELSWSEQNLKIVQETKFPYEERSKIKVELLENKHFAMHIRIPSWLDSRHFEIKINNTIQEFIKNDHGYAVIDRDWADGDLIEVGLPMHTYAEILPDGSQWISFLHGPIVLAADMGADDQVNLLGDDTRMGHIASGPLLPLNQAPLLISENTGQLLGNVHKELLPMTFSLSKVIHQDRYKHLKLVPFNTLHDTRYVIYWPFTSQKNSQDIIDSIARKESIRQDIEKNTIDWVAAGEQQPEVDHEYKGHETKSGYTDDGNYRTSTDWFSYNLKNMDLTAKTLTISFKVSGRHTNFHILINGVKQNFMMNDEDKTGILRVVRFKLGKTTSRTKVINVRFVAAKGSFTPDIYEVRLLR